MSDFEIEKSEEEWRQQLTPEQYRVTREAGTEVPFTGEYCDSKDVGTFHCICCDAALYRSDAKFDSGCGWPSYFEPVSDDAIVLRPDDSLGMMREEILCGRCGAHLGHRFPDGPPPTGLRHCINSVCLKLKDNDEGTEHS